MGFDNPIVGGTALRIPAIQSPNYSPGAAGWIIKIDGSAEFNNLVVRGEFSGTNFIINSAGIFLYSSTPAAGNLIGSWANAAGTDAYTNAYPAGLVVGLKTKPQVHVNNNASAGFIEFPTNRSIENTIASILAGVVNSGAVNEYATLQLFGPTVTGATDSAKLLLNSQNNDGSSEANFSVTTGAGSLTIDKTVATLNGPRLAAFPDASALSALFVNTDAGYTGNMARFQLNAADRFVADNDGILTTYATNAFTTYTPTVAGGGTVTWTTRTGWWMRVGKMVFMNAYLVVNAAGSGGATVTITAPTNIDRTTQQNLSLHSTGIFAAGLGSGSAVALTTGATNVFDGMRTSNNGANNLDGTIGGANLLANGTISITGWYREA
jgi:hypothetical protein